MPKAFLSYSNKERDLVESIAIFLGKNSCVFDKFSFESGKVTFDEILKGLNNTDVFVFFISDASLKSEWVRKELKEAKSAADNNNNIRFFPVLCDSNINHDDPRIPMWLKESYNLRLLDKPYIIYHKIMQQIRELALLKYSSLRAKEDIYVGRSKLTEEFENELFSISKNKPTTIIVSGLDGIGRRTFLRNSLIKTGFFNKTYQPIKIALDTKDSIEDFILNLYNLNSINNTNIFDELNNNMEYKINLAVTLISDFSKHQEFILIIDNGCIVQPNKSIQDWFIQIANTDSCVDYITNNYHANASFTYCTEG